MKKLILKNRKDFKLSVEEKEKDIYEVYYNEVGKKKTSVTLYKEEILEILKWMIGKK